ncbi:hypothetical protein ACN47E_007686 [Coniothyrium glycines]
MENSNMTSTNEQHDELIEKKNRTTVTEHNLTAAHLLRLPAELKNQIYTLVFGCEYWFRDTSGEVYQRPYGGSSLEWVASHGMGLMLVCRQIYNETSLLAYSLPTFKFSECKKTTAKMFVLHRTEAQLEAIQRVVVDAGFPMFGDVGRFTGSGEEFAEFLGASKHG